MVQPRSDAGRPRGGAVPVQDVLDGGADVDALPDLLGAHGPTRAEQVLHDGHQLLAGPEDHRTVTTDGPGEGVVVVLAGLVDEHLGVADDRGERRPELVADRCEEVLLRLAGLGAGGHGVGQGAARLLQGDA